MEKGKMDRCRNLFREAIHYAQRVQSGKVLLIDRPINMYDTSILRTEDEIENDYTKIEKVEARMTAIGCSFQDTALSIIKRDMGPRWGLNSYWAERKKQDVPLIPSVTEPTQEDHDTYSFWNAFGPSQTILTPITLSIQQQHNKVHLEAMKPLWEQRKQIRKQLLLQTQDPNPEWDLNVWGAQRLLQRHSKSLFDSKGWHDREVCKKVFGQLGELTQAASAYRQMLLSGERVDNNLDNTYRAMDTVSGTLAANKCPHPRRMAEMYPGTCSTWGLAGYLADRVADRVE